MASTPPDEALHFRGKTLTPESPRPVHIPEPSNIPVLENQMDPIFNDTSTYEKTKPNGTQDQLYQSALENGSFPERAGGGEGATVGGIGGITFGQGDIPGQTQGHDTGSFHSEPLETNLSDGVPVAIASAYPSENASQTSTKSSSQTQAQEAFDRAVLTSLPPDASDIPSHLDRFQPTAQNPSQPSYAEFSPATYNQSESLVAETPTTTGLNSAQPITPSSALEVTGGGKEGVPETGVDFQNLLDNLAPSASTAPSGPVVTATVSSPPDNSTIPQIPADGSLPTSAGLPPRPPRQQKPSTHPNYVSGDGIRTYHPIHPQNIGQSASSYNPQQANTYPPNNAGLSPLTGVAPGAAPGTSSGLSGLPPPPVATFQQQQQQSPTLSQEATGQVNSYGNKNERHAGRSSQTSDGEAPWGPEVQKKYDEFLHEERIYVTEGYWDRFPPGSRLFVGNLPTERVTKRDLFHLFHKYGKLAQVSIKQAYGFIQFLDADACYRALEAEQGGVVRGRKIHLEISKPQRNTRSGPASSESARGPSSRRSRSPDFKRGGNAGNRAHRAQGGERHDRPYDSGRPPFSDFRDEPATRRRDDYRPPRSPSPRGFRGRGGYRSRDRTPDRYDRRDRRRSRSHGKDRRYRSPSPRSRGGYEGDSNFPFPRRPPRDVPDVQIITSDDIDRNFVFQVENAFKVRGLKVDVLMLSPRISVASAIQRQMDEGVLLVVRLSRNQQFSRKVSLLVFDRSGGTGNTRTNEYPELDLPIAIEMAAQVQSVNRAAVAPSVYPSNAAFSVPARFPLVPRQAQPAIPAISNPGQISNLISTLDGPALQSLLGALQQAQSAPQTTSQAFPSVPTTNSVDLANLLSQATRHQNPLAPVQTQGLAQPQPPQAPHAYGLPVPPNPVVAPDPNLMALLAKGLGGGNPPQNQSTVGPQVQNIVNQLAKWKQ